MCRSATQVSQERLFKTSNGGQTNRLVVVCGLIVCRSGWVRWNAAEERSPSLSRPESNVIEFMNMRG